VKSELENIPVHQVSGLSFVLQLRFLGLITKPLFLTCDNLQTLRIFASYILDTMHNLILCLCI